MRISRLSAPFVARFIAFCDSRFGFKDYDLRDTLICAANITPLWIGLYLGSWNDPWWWLVVIALGVLSVRFCYRYRIVSRRIGSTKFAYPLFGKNWIKCYICKKRVILEAESRTIRLIKGERVHVCERCDPIAGRLESILNDPNSGDEPMKMPLSSVPPEHPIVEMAVVGDSSDPTARKWKGKFTPPPMSG